MTAALAVGMAGVPATVNALDLGDTVDRATGSISKATRSVTRSVSKTVGSTTKSVSKTVGSTTNSLSGTVSSTVGSTTNAVGSTVGSLGTGSGGTSGSGSSGGTSGVLSNYQLLSLGLESNPPAAGQTGNTVTPAYVRALVSGLDRFERQELQVRCDSVLRSPKAYDRELIQLCQILASI
jgi:hypothetical protein